MSVRIRLKRFGTKKKPHRRIVVCDKRRARDGKTIEELGYYDPSKSPSLIVLDSERAKYWMSKGATPSAVVKTLFKKQGVL
ncbi:MAG: 30S ribosomal protein S16 [Candidatus Omnitrophota bacterium]|jgi:small subunit ribosomal protein S16|nr:30S ribosomal protein S16 [Candidatus Omnitrophota bacterium]